MSEDHVLALAAYLGECEQRLDVTRESLAGIQVASRDPFTEALSHLPAQSLAPLVLGVEKLANEARSLGDALSHYAHNSAEQERARVRAWEVPRDRVLALLAVTLARVDPVAPFDQWGVSEAAQAVVGTPGPHLVEVTAVAAAEGGPLPRATNIAERVGRIPAGETPIRIERYVTDSGETEIDVYLAGTQEWGVGATVEPFDMESNLALVAGVSAASMVAVEAAMGKAGVKPGDRVSFVGHSQGGLLAARLAESGRYATSSLLTVGAPLGTVAPSGNYPAHARATPRPRVITRYARAIRGGDEVRNRAMAEKVVKDPRNPTVTPARRAGERNPNRCPIATPRAKAPRRFTVRVAAPHHSGVPERAASIPMRPRVPRTPPAATADISPIFTPVRLPPSLLDWGRGILQKNSVASGGLEHGCCGACGGGPGSLDCRAYCHQLASW